MKQKNFEGVSGSIDHNYGNGKNFEEFSMIVKSKEEVKCAAEKWLVIKGSCVEAGYMHVKKRGKNFWKVKKIIGIKGITIVYDKSNRMWYRCKSTIKRIPGKTRRQAQKACKH